MKVSILLISTGKYDRYVAPLIESIEKYFLPTHNVEIELFTDKYHRLSLNRCKLSQTKIPSIGFPEATLFRYKILTSKEYFSNYLFYMDVDMLIVDYVGNEILGDIVAVIHPGFYSFEGTGAWEENKKSTAYMPKTAFYYAGGFQGGKRENYYRAMGRMRDNIETDKNKGIMASWHDESHWNKYLYENKGFLSLSPSYCMPEPQFKREEWKIDKLVPRILAIEKEEGIK